MTSSLIRNHIGLVDRAAVLATECPIEPFKHYPYAQELQVGLFPNREFFKNECEPYYWRSLKKAEGILCPYYGEITQTLTHLAIVRVRDDGSRDGDSRVIIPCKGVGSSPTGIFGFKRLKWGIATAVITDDETLVARYPDVIAIPKLSPKITGLLQRTVANVILRSTDDRWIRSMFELDRTKINVTVSARNPKGITAHPLSVIEWTVERVMDDLKAGLSEGPLLARLEMHVDPLHSIDRVKALQLLHRRTGVNFEKLLPDKFKIFSGEDDFYTAVRNRVDEEIESIILGNNGLIITTRTGDIYDVPNDGRFIQAAFCQIMGNYMDLVAWAYDDLKEIPLSYFRRNGKNEIRSAVAQTIGDVVTSVITGKASMKR